jgi:hypothetical protein
MTPLATKLEHFWDRLSDGGVLIIDYYGHWRGAREAVDEFFESAGRGRCSGASTAPAGCW